MDLASHPLVSTMHRLAEINQFFNLPVREPEEDGWIEATDLFLNQSEGGIYINVGRRLCGGAYHQCVGSGL